MFTLSEPVDEEEKMKEQRTSDARLLSLSVCLLGHLRNNQTKVITAPFVHEHLLHFSPKHNLHKAIYEGLIGLSTILYGYKEALGVLEIDTEYDLDIATAGTQQILKLE